MTTHILKTWPEPFKATCDYHKLHEFRKNDRDFQVGDDIDLLEWNPETQQYTGASCIRRVKYITRGPDFGVPVGYVVMSIE